MFWFFIKFRYSASNENLLLAESYKIGIYTEGSPFSELPN